MQFLNLFSHGLLTRFASIVISVNDLLTSMTEMSELRFLHHFSIINYSISKKKNVHCTKKGLTTVANQKGQPLPLQSIRQLLSYFNSLCVLLKHRGKLPRYAKCWVLEIKVLKIL